MWKVELTMSKLLNKLSHSGAWYCYGEVFLDVFFKDSVIHSLVHSTVPVHFPVKRLEMPIPKSIPFTEIVHCLLTHHLTLHLLNFEHHCTRRLMFTFQLIVIACALT